MSPLSKKNQNPFAPDELVTATKTFAYEDGVVHAGQHYRGGDPAVVANWSAFEAGEKLPHELPNMWDAVPVPEHASPLVPTVPIAGHRQMRSMVDVFTDGGWAPGSAGSRSSGGLQPSRPR
jgi:hypothetical protein